MSDFTDKANAWDAVIETHKKYQPLIDAARKVCEPEPIELNGQEVCPIPVEDILALHEALDKRGES